jgi:hypothetical protein
VREAAAATVQSTKTGGVGGRDRVTFNFPLIFYTATTDIHVAGQDTTKCGCHRKCVDSAHPYT